jgi:hypothetical protein
VLQSQEKTEVEAMYVIRNVFKCKPGKAKNVIEKFKATHALISNDAVRPRVLVDEVAGFWTVVAELEVDDLAAFDKLMHERGSREDVQQAMAGYTDLVDSGYREIFRIA